MIKRMIDKPADDKQNISRSALQDALFDLRVLRGLTDTSSDSDMQWRQRSSIHVSRLFDNLRAQLRSLWYRRKLLQMRRGLMLLGESVTITDVELKLRPATLSVRPDTSVFLSRVVAPE